MTEASLLPPRVVRRHPQTQNAAIPNADSANSDSVRDIPRKRNPDAVSKRKSQRFVRNAAGRQFATQENGRTNGLTLIHRMDASRMLLAY